MAKKIIEKLRDFPSVEELLQSKQLAAYIKQLPRPLVSLIVKEVVASLKKEFKNTEISYGRLYRDIKNSIDANRKDEISRMINATGIVVHTNLGRAPLSDELFDAVKQTVTGYGNIEFDISKGIRGSRGEACEKYLTLLSTAEAATVVNNCAAALFIILNSFANRKKVIISRSELVQIGGGFRIPDILKKSGARLEEIGATNITTIEDYENAIDDRTAMILKVHQSNFVQKGFTQQVSIKELSALSKKYNLPLINDLGSGVFIPTKPVLGYNEPTVQQSVKDGADITCFSGDKMLGGPQAGLIVGSKEYIQKIKKNPLFRTLRVDKIVFSMLEKLLAAYLNNRWMDEIKLWQILSVPEAELYKRGKKILADLGHPKGLAVEATQAFVGGGALPESKIPSVAVVFSPELKAKKMFDSFKSLNPPVIGRIENERYLLDLKAVDEADLAILTRSIKKVLS